MPLPPALAARLAKRGIISKDQAKAKTKANKTDKEDQRSGTGTGTGSSSNRGHEEVFAENYDGDEDTARSKRHKGGHRGVGTEVEDKIKFMGYPGCPNKWNVYHECGLWCQNTWGSGKATPDPEYLARFKKMMDKYGPLPEDWKEKYDAGSGRHYFWCTRTDRVSWLPPGHPKAKPMESASRMREILASQTVEDEDEDSNSDSEDEEEMDLDSDADSEEERDRRDRERDRSRRREEHDRYRRSKGGRSRGREDRVDPMDPSSYSDAPRGNWASGLEKARESK